MKTRWQQIVVIFAMVSLIDALFWGHLAAFSPLFLPELGVRPDDVPFWTGFVAAVASLIGIPFLPLWGALADRYTRKLVIIRSFLFYLAGGLMTILAGNIWLLLVGRSVVSLSLGHSGLMMASLSDQVPEQRKSLAFAILNATTPVGVFLGPLLAGPLFDRYGFRPLIAADCVLLLIAILTLALASTDDSPGPDRRPVRLIACESGRLLWDLSYLRIYFVALSLLFAGWTLASVYLPIVVTTRYPTTQPGTLVGHVLGAGGIGAVLLAPGLGLLADRLGALRVLLVSSVIEALLWLAPMAAPTVLSFALLWAIVNGIASGVFALSFKLLSDALPSAVRGRMMVFSYLPSMAGYAFGCAISSLINVSWLFPLAACMTLSGALTLYAIHQKHGPG